MDRLGINDYLYYLKLCLIANLRKKYKYVSDKEISKNLGYKSLIQYANDVELSRNIKFNIVDHQGELIDIHALQDLIE